MRTVRAILLLALALAIASASGCVLGGDDDDGGSPTPVPTPRYRIYASPPSIVEESPATFSVRVTTSAGASTTWSGTIAISSEEGPVNPSTLDVVAGEANPALTFERGGADRLIFRAQGLTSALSYVFIAPQLPVRVAGPATGGAVLEGGTGWDAAGVFSPSVALDGVAWRMWYAATDTAGVGHIGHAESTDGLAWVKSGTAPVVGPSVAAAACHADGASLPAVARDGAGWLMLYQGTTAGRRHVCRATSADGIVWMPVAGTQEDGSVLAASVSGFDNVGLRGVAIVKLEDGSWRAIYAGDGTADLTANHPGPETISGLGLASSLDGVTWTRVATQSLGALMYSYAEALSGTTWDAYEHAGPTVVRDGDVFRLWSHGRSEGGLRLGYHATLDPTYWGPHVDNLGAPFHEILGPGPASSFDDAGVESPSVVVLSNGTRWIFYTGRRATGPPRIGVATF